VNEKSYAEMTRERKRARPLYLGSRWGLLGTWSSPQLPYRGSGIGLALQSSLEPESAVGVEEEVRHEVTHPHAGQEGSGTLRHKGVKGTLHEK
jgi:hypothetical protein